MTVYDLNRDQLEELKQHYLTENFEEQGYGISHDVLADADNIISDERIYEIYAGTEFSPDDFFCSAGQEDEDQVTLEINASGNKYDIANDLRQIANDIENGYYSGLANYGASWSIE